ncbi:P-loop containing nucleoside triphosphate hydrolase protein [Mycena albidolilacea]|uniref:H/ACA ribonucleoprotein complex subunit GAR1 n=1 Tax=Mycena albidolilacea TaxID=1033008 RepID=A0AAD7A4L1_9AGAR|nr:P-loop containing nucleoside triphosphate hydrolase protein [Mycena albidolilacea]
MNRGGSRGGFGRGGARGGGRGGFQQRDFGPPDTVLEMGTFIHAVEDEMLCSSLMPDKVPYFNAPIYLQNKSVIGKVDEILGPINEVYFSIKMGDGMVASSFKKGDKVYIGGDKLLPIDRFLPKPKVAGAFYNAQTRHLTNLQNEDAVEEHLAGAGGRGAVDAEDFSQEVVRAAVEGPQGDLAVTGAEVGVDSVGVDSGGGAATGVDSGLGVPRVDEEVEAGTVGAGIDAARKRMYNRTYVARSPFPTPSVGICSTFERSCYQPNTTMAMQFWKPGTTAPGSSLDRETEAEDYAVPSAISSLSIQSDKLLYAIEKHGVIIVVGQTGCGKTTQLPQYLMESGWAQNGNIIACTQPRRVAATSVAGRVASEVGSILGDERYQVGYTIRFEDIDEAHERSVYTDLLLGVLKKIRRKRPSLRLIVSSATLDATSFLDYFTASTSPEEATIVSLEGRMYPVEVAYLQEPAPDYVRKAAEVAWNINLQQGPGDILVFLTGREDIERCLEEFSDLLPTLPKTATRLVPLALHAGLSTDEQLRVFEPAARGTRKVIISTNIAEASVTIEGIKFVVDCGFVKIRVYNPTTALASLATVPTSVASATQRAGRAGRTSPGVCYRLYPISTFNALPLSTAPEITRTDMTTPILQLKSLGIDDLMKFEWVSAPPAESVLRALEGLVAAGMIGEDGRLTVIGEQVAECPVEVGVARMVRFAGPLSYNAFTRYGRSSGWCKSHALSFRAMSRAVSIRAQLKKYMQRFNLPTESCEGDAKRLRRCLVSGYWRNGARWVADGTYRSVRGNRTLHVHPTSVLFTRKPRSGWVIFHEMEETKKTQ